MPIYRVTAPDGRSVKLEGDSPPTEVELEEIFATIPAAAPTTSTAPTDQVIETRASIPQQIIGTAKDVFRQFGAGAAETGLRLQPIEEAIAGVPVSPRRPDIITEEDIPEATTFAGGIARFIGSLSEPIIPGAPPGTGAFAPIAPLAKSTSAKILASGGKHFPGIARFIEAGKNLLDPTQFRKTYDFVTKTVGGVSDEAADIVYDNPSLISLASSKKAVTPGGRISFTTPIKESINASNRRQKEAVDFVVKNLPDFIEKTEDKGKLTAVLLDSGANANKVSKIISDPKKFLGRTNTASDLSKRTLNTLLRKKQGVSKKFGEALDDVFKNESLSDITDVVDNFTDNFNRITASPQFTRKGSKGFTLGSSIIKKINSVKPSAIKLEVGPGNVLIPKKVKEGAVKLTAKDMHIMKKIIQDGISEKEITGDVAFTLNAFADDLNNILRSNHTEYARVNDFFSKTIRDIESIVGKKKAGKLHDENVFRQFRNRLSATGKASGEKLEEDVIDVVRGINSSLADDIETFSISKLEKPVIEKFIKNSVENIHEDLTLKSFKNRLGNVSNLSKGDLIQLIDNFAPPKIKYFDEIKKTLAVNEFTKKSAGNSKNILTLLNRLIVGIAQPQKRAAQITSGARGATEGVSRVAAPIVRGAESFFTPERLRVGALRQISPVFEEK